jgi:hypothetical protein|nr:MAG TPA: hypothetical protein [Caudoviricetes sp.]
MKEVCLRKDLVLYKRTSVTVLVNRLDELMKSNYGVLTGNMIWFELLDRLGVDAEKEILETFAIKDLKSKIYGINDIGLYKEPETMSLFLMFKIDEDQKECGTRNVAKHLAEIRDYIKMIKSESVPIAEVDITASSAEVNFSKDDSVAHDIVTNMFDNVSAVFKDLNAIKSETGVELEVYMTAVGIHFESSKNNLVFSISVTKSDLDNVTDVATPIQKTIDIAIKKVID